MKHLKTYKEINEEADYMNVTGYGTMGNAGDQHVTSFSKGPMSFLVRQPELVGVVSDEIEDPYFDNKKIKLRRKKKNRKIEQMRIDKSTKLRNMDIKSRKNLESFNEGAGTIIMAGIFFIIFLRKLIKDIKDRRYQKMLTKIINDLHNDDLKVTTNTHNILIKAGRYIVMINKDLKTANFFEIGENGMAPIHIEDGKMFFISERPIQLTDDQYEFLIRNIESKKNVFRI